MSDILDELAKVLEQRKQASADDSYVASLFDAGINKILEKVGEECTETIIAAKDCAQSGGAAEKQALIGETADLWFHSLVMLSKLNVEHQDVLNELGRRFGVSGLEEKASRDK